MLEKTSTMAEPRSDGIAVLDPRTGELVRTLTPSTAEQLRAAVTRAADAFWEWSRTSPGDRGARLRAAADAVAAHAEELARLNERETGRPFEDALGGVRAGVSTLEQYVELGPLHQGAGLRGAASALDLSIPEPRGVVAVVTPWNDPVAIAAGLIGAAVVTGNTVVHKPSELSPSVGTRFAELVADALPAGVLEVVEGDGRTGAALCGHAEVAMIAHVGSTETGTELAAIAGRTGAHLIRENGGNDALVVDAGVDPAWAAEQAALGAFANAGQICTSVERIFVVDEVAQEFLGQLVAAAKRLNGSSQLGPLVSESLRDRVHAQVVAAERAGATLRAGGVIPAGDGFHYPATVIVDPPLFSELLTEETFGPVAAVVRVTDFDEGLELARRDRYGLAASVLTRDLGHARRAISDLDVGTVKVNQVFGGAPGGSAEPRRASGSGFGYGPRLLDEMTEVKVVHISMEIP